MDTSKLLTYGATVGSLALSWVGGLQNVFKRLVLDTIELCVDGDAYDVAIGDDLDLERIFPPVFNNVGQYYIGSVEGKEVKNVIKKYNVSLSTQLCSWYSFVGKIPVLLEVSTTSEGAEKTRRIARISYPKKLLKKEQIWDKLLESPIRVTNKEYCSKCIGNPAFSEVIYPKLEEVQKTVVCTHNGPVETKWIWNKEIIDLKESVGRFLKSENWYESRHIPWRFGIVLYGQPGNGKSEFINNLIEEFNLERNELNSEKDSLRKTGDGDILVIEDYDSVFDGRKNVSISKKGDFADLLKIIDGHKGLVVITTNKLSSLDSAIGLPEEDGTSTRPGRINRVVEMPFPDQVTRTALAKKILDGTDYEKFVTDLNGKTYAQFVDACATEALIRRWSKVESSR